MVLFFCLRYKKKFVLTIKSNIDVYDEKSVTLYSYSNLDLVRVKSFIEGIIENHLKKEFRSKIVFCNEIMPKNSHTMKIRHNNKTKNITMNFPYYSSEEIIDSITKNIMGENL